MTGAQRSGALALAIAVAALGGVALLPGVLATAQDAAAAQGTAAEETPDAAERGEYVFHAAGCQSCHTDKDNDGPFLAGGRAIASPFGTFYGTNITPDPPTGIGGWTGDDFVRAMTEGVGPEGQEYYPVFPYPWYTRMTRQDLLDLWAYLETVEPVRHEVPPHEVAFPLTIRPLVNVWKLLNFEQEERAPLDPEASRLWNRGSYVVNALAHCGACHTPTDALGNYIEGLFLAGSAAIPGELAAPNITPHEASGIGTWSEDDIVQLLATGLRPDGMPVEGLMAEVVADTTSRLTAEDRRAIAVYVRSVPAVDHEPEAAEDDGGLFEDVLGGD